MWRGRLLEVLGLGLIVTAFMNFTGSTTGWIDAVAGCLIALAGTSLWRSTPRPALVANVTGLCILMAAMIPPFRSHSYNIWIATCLGLTTWVVGWHIVAAESGGPWRLKDRPVY